MTARGRPVRADGGDGQASGGCPDCPFGAALHDVYGWAEQYFALSTLRHRDGRGDCDPFEVGRAQGQADTIRLLLATLRQHPEATRRMLPR